MGKLRRIPAFTVVKFIESPDKAEKRAENVEKKREKEVQFEKLPYRGPASRGKRGKIEGISAFESRYHTEFHIAQLCECINIMNILTYISNNIITTERRRNFGEILKYLSI